MRHDGPHVPVLERHKPQRENNGGYAAPPCGSGIADSPYQYVRQDCFLDGLGGPAVGQVAHRGNSRGFIVGRVVIRLDLSVSFKGYFGSVIFAGGRFVTHVGARSLLKILLVGCAASEANRSLSSITPRPM
jgi:hypothetical protein